MMTRNQVSDDFKRSTTELLSALRESPDDIFNTAPQEESWSVGMVAEHLIKVETGTVRLLTGSVDKTEREPGLKIEQIEEEFLDFEKKFTAYGPIVPAKGEKDKKRALEKLQDIRQRIASLINLEDLSLLVNGFKHPLFGKLTRLEWIYFTIIHSKRHVNQIKEIVADVEGTNSE